MIDYITAAWLILASLFTLRHAWRTWQARSALSVSLGATAFFTGFAAWNVFFFAYLGAHASALASGLLTIAHALWLAIQIHYRRTTNRLTDDPYQISILEIMK
jgi:apolipoprotein N-acyltransferase